MLEFFEKYMKEKEFSKKAEKGEVIDKDSFEEYIKRALDSKAHEITIVIPSGTSFFDYDDSEEDFVVGGTTAAANTTSTLTSILTGTLIDQPQ
jgi:hypothetical protein